MLSKLLKEQIQNHKVISFDVFDTLIKRNVEKYEDVFTLVQIKYENIHQNQKLGFDFTQKRKNAYVKARQNLKEFCGLEDIYDYIEIENKSLKKELMNLEIDIEKRISVSNQNVIDIYEYAIGIGKNVVLISDMYLSTNIIRFILDKCGIKGYSALFVSCDYGKSKTDGDLYLECCQQMNISTKDLFHIGDGWKNDVIRAKILGIDCYHVSNTKKIDYSSKKEFNNKEKFQYSIQQSIIRNNIASQDTVEKKLGFQVIGPILLGFSKWLNQIITDQGIEKIFFLAREGLILKKAYDLINGDSKKEGQYLYVSRKSLIIPTYWIQPDYESIINSIAKTKTISISTLIGRWGLEVNDCISELQYCDIQIDESIDGRNINKNPKIKKLFECLIDKIICNSKEKYELLKRYLEKENFGGKCIIVDVGWNGSMQNALEKIASIWEVKTEIHGCYLGISSKNSGIQLKHTYGYIYEDNYNEKNRYYIYSFAGPLELSLMAPHGTTLGYHEEEDNLIVPTLDQGESYTDIGKLTNEINYSKAVQKGAMSYLKIAGDFDTYPFTNIFSEVAFRNCKLFGLMPLAKHIKIFTEFEGNDLGNWQHFVSSKYKHLIGKNSIVKGFWASTWKCAYMKARFKLPLPYYKLYVWMRKLVDS